MPDLVFPEFPPVVNTQQAQEQYQLARTNTVNGYVTIQNQLQFLPTSDPNYQTVIDYANASTAYVTSSLNRLPPPVTNPYFAPIIPTIVPPDTTDFSQVAIETVNACYEGQTIAYTAYFNYERFFANVQNPTKWTPTQLQEILDNYVPLIIKQYSKYGNGQNAYCFNLWFARIITEFSNAFNNIIQAFQLPTATGKQLDCLGEYIGADRKYIWKSEDGTETFYNLTDAQYRIILYMAIGTFQSNSSYASMANTLYLLFNKSIKFIFDNTVTNVMVLYYLAVGLNYYQQVSFHAALAKNVLPRPAGVGVIVAFGKKPFFTISRKNVMIPWSIENPGLAFTPEQFTAGQILQYNGIFR